MSGPPRVTIAGAGVLGLTTALTLADAGCGVTVYDPGRPNASSVAAGMIAPVFEAVLDETARPHLDLLLAARDLWPALAARAGIALDRSGAMAVGDDGWLDILAGGFGRLHERPAEIGGDTARGLTPGLSEDVGRALLSREDWRVDAPSALAALRAAALDAGVRFAETRLDQPPGEGLLIAATGADRGLVELAPELDLLTPIKGHIARLNVAADGVTVRSQGVYVVPGAKVAFGATMEPGVADEAVDPVKVQPLVAAGLALFPGLSGAAVEVAAGARAATPDGLPMVGASVAEGVLLAVGSRRNGWLLAPLAARILTACVTGADAGPFAGRLDPARFRG